jgi:hypothetical protein
MPDKERMMTNAPFLAHLPLAEVELVAIANMPWTNRDCWLPNGQSSAAPFPTRNFDISNWSKDMEIKKIAFYIRNESAEGISTPVCRISQESGAQPGSSGWAAPDKRNPVGLFGQIIVCPKGASTMNVSLGVANGVWETAVALEHQNNFGGAKADGDWSATWGAVVGSNGDVAINCSCADNTNSETRMVDVDDAGNLTVIPKNSFKVSTLSTGGILLVSSNEFAHIKEFQLQRRKYQWVEFRNVALQPGLQTAVAIGELDHQNPGAAGSKH